MGIASILIFPRYLRTKIHFFLSWHGENEPLLRYMSYSMRQTGEVGVVYSSILTWILEKIKEILGVSISLGCYCSEAPPGIGKPL